MKNLIAVAMVVAMATVALAKPAAKPVPVAAGFPDWQGLEERNYVRGRHICAADLRQKVAVVVVIDAAKAADHLKQTMGVGRAFSPCTTDTQWETENIRRDFIALYTFAGASYDWQVSPVIHIDFGRPRRASSRTSSPRKSART